MPRPGELPDEFTLRKLVARTRLKATKAALKAAGLATHAAANMGRRNRDWKASNGSADLANIPDSLTLIGRSRQLVRDSWIARSIVRAFARNVVGRQINVVPHAKDPNGRPLTKLNQKVSADFGRWARSKRCDVERRKTLGQMERLAAKEKITAGEHLWMWSYQQDVGPDGRLSVDQSQPIGFSLQAFEPEQFDLRILSYEGREVRGGVEVDENGAPLAVHIYTRNPNDVLYRHAFFSERVPITRCFHYFEQERVLQSRGVTGMTPVMQDVRDLERGKGAHLTRWLMEACIGAAITTDLPVSVGGLAQVGQSTIPPAPGDSGQTPSGMTEADFVPGMVANLRPGEKVEFITPTTPGGQYEPFTTLTVRGIGAGVGMSYGQVMRQSDGNYSSARQDMLEDRKEWEPEQELIIDDLIRPAYEKWYTFMALEGRFDGVEGFDKDDFLANRHRYLEADFIPPPQTWIDPEKEANGWVVMLKNRLITREEIAAMRGQQYFPMLRKIAAELAEAEEEGLSLPEQETEIAAYRELVKAILTNKVGTIDSMMANLTDFRGLAEKAGIPTLTEKDAPIQPLLPVVSPAGQLATGDPVKNKEGEIIGGGVTAPAPPPTAPPPPGSAAAPHPANGNGAVKPVNGNGNGRPAPAPGANRLKALDGREIAAHGPNDGYQPTPNMGIQEQAREENAVGNGVPVSLMQLPANVPHYRTAKDPVISCATCSFLEGERCSRFNFAVDLKGVCDDWRAATLTENIGAPNTAKSFPPGPQDGQRDLESGFYPSADTSPRMGPG